MKSLSTHLLITIFSLSFYFASSTSHAEDAPTDVSALPAASETLFQKFYRDLSSPVMNPTALSILAGGTASTLTLLGTHKDFEDKLLEDTARARPLGDYSKFGDIMGQLVPNVAYTAWFAGRYFITDDPVAAFRAELMFRATFSATLMSTFLKTTIREPRPSNDSELTSCPSGHATSIFAFATVIAALHGRIWGLGAFGLAAFVATSRLNDDRHRLHDVVAGATLGSIYGLALYDRMREKAKPAAEAGFEYEVMPIVSDDGGALLGLSARF